MMHNLGFTIKLLKQFFIVLIAYTICRLLFITFNFSQFNLNSIPKFLNVIIQGVRFDISAISYTNLPYFILALIPLKNKIYTQTINLYFVLTNALLILINIIDLEYFKFTKKRTTFDLFSLLGMGDKLEDLILPFFKDYWYILFLYTSILYLFYKLNRTLKTPPLPKNYLTHSVGAILFLILIIVGVRGGFQLKPIDIIHASKYSKPENANAILNTPFTIIKTVFTQSISQKKYFPEKEFNKYSNLIHHPKKDSTFKKPNIVLIILESFSKKYITHSTTPFLDSLSQQSTNYINAYANAKKSIEGIPAIISSTPALMTTPFIQSNYTTNTLTSFPSLLNKFNYATSFYHGGNNGTMGFDSYCKLVGFKNYKGRTEYPTKNHYDGTWGIYDEHYFQYFANECKATKAPFFNTIFSLSSHHPYKIPEEYQQVFTDSDPIKNTMRYTDFSLKKFFDTAKKMPWFNNTVFIITADHTAASSDNLKEVYEIPLIIYRPNNTPNTISSIISQIDILPTVMNIINYPEPFFAFGKDVHINTDGYNVNYLIGIYQIIDKKYVLLFDGEKSIALYNYKLDPALKQNKIGTDISVQNKLEKKLKVHIQEFNNNTIHNNLTVP